MSNVGSADLQHIAQEMTGLLEHRISELLGHVKAAREVTAELLEADAELTRLQGSRERLAAVLEPLGSDAPEAVDLRRRLDQTNSLIEGLTTQRQQLMAGLETLKSKLHA